MTFRSLRVALPIVLAGAFLAGCQADYAADIMNNTPQPIFTYVFRKGPSSPVLGDSRRLGPGDHNTVGPVRTTQDYGAFLSIETTNTRGRPLTVDLHPGTSSFEIQQDGEHPDAPIRIIDKR
jgi:hypothetical protein